MKIHFTCSTAQFNEHKQDYFKIRELLINQGHLLTRDWLPHTYERIKAKRIELTDIKEIYQANLKALKEAELVIVEDTVSNFSTGHQITLALQQKKPTLVLWKGQKHRQFKQMFIHGIESNILQVSQYDSNNLNQLLASFIGKFAATNETNRFHLVLSGVERQYLDWAQFHKGKSRTKIITEALHKEIKSDKSYQDFLQSGSLEN